MTSRIIFHIDLDAFFASVEQRDNPSLKGKPVIIGADPKGGKGRGVVSTCSYEARAFGIHSAMPIAQAYRACPHGIYVKPNMAKYHQASEDVFHVFEEFSPDMQTISVDEAFLDMTGSCHLFGTPKEAAEKLRQRVKDQIGLTASVGIAPNMMVAKIASDHCKPDGLLQINDGGVLEFLHPLKIRKLWGVGPKTQQVLENLGIFTVGDIAKFSEKKLYDMLGESGIHLYALSHGIDDRKVEADDGIKSISHEETFETDTEDQRLIFDTLLELSEKVSRRLRAHELQGRLLTLKVRLTNFKTHSHSVRFDERTNHADKIFKKSKELFIDHFVSTLKHSSIKQGDKSQLIGSGFRPQDFTSFGTIRLIGVRISNFDDGYIQDSLFVDEKSERSEAVHRALDKIQDKFGSNAVKRAGGF